MTKLYRSRYNQKLGGVCAGLAQYFGVDVTIVRLLTVLIFLTGGGTLAYILAWIFIPLEPATSTGLSYSFE